jgi:hypothetical protein
VVVIIWRSLTQPVSFQIAVSDVPNTPLQHR